MSRKAKSKCIEVLQSEYEDLLRLQKLAVKAVDSSGPFLTLKQASLKQSYDRWQELKDYVKEKYLGKQ